MLKMLIIYGIAAFLITTFQGCGSMLNLMITGNTVTVGDENQVTADQQITQTTTLEFKQEWNKQRKLGQADAQKTLGDLDALVPPHPSGGANAGTIEY